MSSYAASLLSGVSSRQGSDRSSAARSFRLPQPAPAPATTAAAPADEGSETPETAHQPEIVQQQEPLPRAFAEAAAPPAEQQLRAEQGASPHDLAADDGSLLASMAAEGSEQLQPEDKPSEVLPAIAAPDSPWAAATSAAGSALPASQPGSGSGRSSHRPAGNGSQLSASAHAAADEAAQSVQDADMQPTGPDGQAAEPVASPPENISQTAGEPAPPADAAQPDPTADMQAAGTSQNEPEQPAHPAIRPTGSMGKLRSSRSAPKLSLRIRSFRQPAEQPAAQLASSASAEVHGSPQPDSSESQEAPEAEPVRQERFTLDTLWARISADHPSTLPFVGVAPEAPAAQAAAASGLQPQNARISREPSWAAAASQPAAAVAACQQPQQHQTAAHDQASPETTAADQEPAELPAWARSSPDTASVPGLTGEVL